MPWLVGIDEAGYGPNLGPFVMASVACRVPDAPCDLWQLLQAGVRRPKQPEDGRLLVEDSKVVYSTSKGLRALERGVLAIVGKDLLHGGEPCTLECFVGAVAPEALPELRVEAWFTGTTCLPLELKPRELELPSHLFQQACTRASAAWITARAAIVCPPRFNALLDRWGSKSIVLALGMAELVRPACLIADAEPVHIVIDKQGGRNSYAQLLQQGVPQGTVASLEEGAERSRYEVIGAGRAIHVCFEPRADAGHFTVALASMLAKYLRELFMHEFNAFWRQHIPDIEPTAGYPADAGRFLEQIRPTMTALGISADTLWRRK